MALNKPSLDSRIQRLGKRVLMYDPLDRDGEFISDIWADIEREWRESEKQAQQEWYEVGWNAKMKQVEDGLKDLGF